MEWKALTKLREFLDGTPIFGRTELIELTFLICARQKEVGKLAIWIDADEEVNPISIEIFDDEFGILSANGLEKEILDLFSQDSDQVAQEFVQFDEDDGTAQYEVYFPTEEAELESWINEISPQVLNALKEYKPIDAFEKMLRQFCIEALTS